MIGRERAGRDVGGVGEDVRWCAGVRASGGGGDRRGLSGDGHDVVFIGWFIGWIAGGFFESSIGEPALS